MAAALRDKGYTPFVSSRQAETGSTSTSRGGGLLTAVSSKYVAEHKVLSFTEVVPGTSAALQIRTDKGCLTLLNVRGPQAGCTPWAGRAAFWADIQTYATARSLGGRHPILIAGDTNVYIDATTNPATEHFRADWQACGLQKATAGGEEDVIPTLHPSRHRVDTFLVNAPPAVVPAGERLGPRHGAPPGDWVGPPPGPPGPSGPPRCGRAHSGAHPLQPHEGPPPPVRCRGPACPALPVGSGHRCTGRALSSALACPAEQHAYGSMPAAAGDKMFKHLHAAHDALAHTVSSRQPSPAGSDPAGGDPPESGKRLQAAILRYDALAACVPAVYQANAAQHGIHCEAALRLTEALQGA